MNKIFVVGGSGRVATELIKDLAADGKKVIAGSRHPESIIKIDGVTSVKLDLHSSVDEIADLMKGVDAVYFVAGSRGKDLLQTDAMGAVKTMKAAEKNKIKRYIMLSSLYALQPEKWREIKGLETLIDYQTAKFFADNYLITNTHLSYTILQPTALTEEPGTGKVKFSEIEAKTNPIPDVARVLADIIKHDNTIGKVIMMQTGNTPIEEALHNI
ncbi:hypothetical protein M9Y10_017822 [Tritrichomonas musculus]|uniref:NAD(P)-binding domain-containing protein n=1 Tax=Tritrichomonas musculus TaxID=1915356 RepID=A0ABR2HUH2_9EUKA